MVPRLLVSTNPTRCEEEIQVFLNANPGLSNSVYKIVPEEGKSITIEQIRQLKKELLVSSTQRVVIIYDFQTAKVEAQNALLKTLEDQTANNQFILCTQHLGAMLPTIISRCSIEQLTQHALVEKTDTGMEDAIDALLQGGSYAFLHAEYFQATTVDEAKSIFRDIIQLLHKRVKRGDSRAASLVTPALELMSLLHSNNLNPQLTIDSWCLLARKNGIIK